mmetsp:Transcript_14766/g.31096  ORF Transcript_14766/g.31096 Transcript_14766/m.31096 type:complete len:144 (-) Transcript_14766:581-1012(-)
MPCDERNICFTYNELHGIKKTHLDDRELYKKRRNQSVSTMLSQYSKFCKSCGTTILFTSGMILPKTSNAGRTMNLMKSRCELANSVEFRSHNRLTGNPFSASKSPWAKNFDKAQFAQCLATFNGLPGFEISAKCNMKFITVST